MFMGPISDKLIAESKHKPETFPDFPSDGDPKSDLFNLMSRTLEERTAMGAQADAGEQKGDGAKSRKRGNNGRRKSRNRTR